MAYPSDICLDLSLGNDSSFGNDTGAPRRGDTWRPSFLSSNGPLTVEDSVMMDTTTATVVAKNLLTPRDNLLLSRRSDELAVQDSMAFSIQCASSVSNMGQRLLARSRQVESLMAEVATLSHEIRQLKRENRELHVLANNYSAGMKRKLDQLLDSEGRVQHDRQKFADVFWRHFLPSSSGVRPSIEAPNNPSSVPSVPPSASVLPSTEASHK